MRRAESNQEQRADRANRKQDAIDKERRERNHSDDRKRKREEDRDDKARRDRNKAADEEARRVDYEIRSRDQMDRDNDDIKRVAVMNAAIANHNLQISASTTSAQPSSEMRAPTMLMGALAMDHNRARTMPTPPNFPPPQRPRGDPPLSLTHEMKHSENGKSDYGRGSCYQCGGHDHSKRNCTNACPHCGTSGGRYHDSNCRLAPPKRPKMGNGQARM
jgi:hypothetical protein